MAKNGGNENGAVQFDLTRIGIFDIEDFVAAARKSDFRTAAAIMARCCVKCPEAWGPPNEPASFNRPPVGEWAWKDVVMAMMQAVNDTGEE